ncbi:MAG: PAS domain-containing sensor histidine kinase, partial [Chitinophagaceae bacterium]
DPIQNELEQVRAQLSLFLEASEAAHYLIYIQTPSKNFFSDKWHRLLGFNPYQAKDPLVEKTNLVLIKNIKEYEKKWQELENANYVLLKYQIQHPLSGKILWLEEEVFKKYSPVTQEEIWVGTIKDISGIEFYKEYIAESEKRFQQITDKLPIIIWVSDEEDNLTYYNDLARKFFQLSPTEKRKIGGLEQWVHPDHRNRIEEEWNQKVIRRESINTELLLKGNDNKYHLLSILAVPRFLKQKTFIGYIGVTYDLTNEYELRIEREKAYAALKESEEKYRNLFENMELGILEVDNNDSIQYCNKAFEKIVGYLIEELLGKNASELLLNDSKSKKMMAVENRIRRKGKESVYEVNIQRKNKQIARVIISGIPLFDREGKIRGSVGIHWDVTEIQKIEKALMNERLKKEQDLIEARLQAEDQQRTKIGRDLHDGVGQMLAYIGMYVDMLKSKGSLNPDEFTKLEGALQNTLEQVRTLSRTLAPPALQDLGLRDSIRELIDSYAILKKPVFDLQIYAQREDYNLNQEKKMIVYRILQELLNNTFKYAEAKQVRILLYFKEKKFFMEYSDDGKGYDPKSISKGVGLESMHSRITFYKGTLVLNSAPGKGSKANIILPIG